MKRPPKRWFRRCEKALGSRAEIDDPKAVCGWIWYHHAKKRTKEELMEMEEEK